MRLVKLFFFLFFFIGFCNNVFASSIGISPAWVEVSSQNPSFQLVLFNGGQGEQNYSLSSNCEGLKFSESKGLIPSYDKVFLFASYDEIANNEEECEVISQFSSSGEVILSAKSKVNVENSQNEEYDVAGFKYLDSSSNLDNDADFYVGIGIVLLINIVGISLFILLHRLDYIQ